MKKDDGRLQAYGWSLPARVQPATMQKDSPRQSQVPVPVPVYCRPLLEQANGMKVIIFQYFKFVTGKWSRMNVTLRIYFSYLHGIRLVVKEDASLRQ